MGLKGQIMNVRNAFVRTNDALSRHFWLLCFPVVFVGLSYRGIAGLVQSLTTKGHFLILFLISLPIETLLGLIAQTAVAAMYLRCRQSMVPALEQIQEVLRYRSVRWMFARFAAILWGWIVVSLVIAIVLLGVWRMVRHPVHGQHAAPAHATSALPLLLLFFLFYGWLAAKYSFVLPLTVMRESGAIDVWRDALALGNRHIRLLRIVTVVEYIVIGVAGHVAVRMAAGAVAWQARSLIWGTVAGLVVGMLTTYFEVVKTELMVQAVGMADRLRDS
jgi:hypothetical protein